MRYTFYYQSKAVLRELKYFVIIITCKRLTEVKWGKQRTSKRMVSRHWQTGLFVRTLFGKLRAGYMLSRRHLPKLRTSFHSKQTTATLRENQLIEEPTTYFKQLAHKRQLLFYNASHQARMKVLLLSKSFKSLKYWVITQV